MIGDPVPFGHHQNARPLANNAIVLGEITFEQSCAVSIFQILDLHLLSDL